MDAIWIHNFTAESADNVLASVFWVAEGIIYFYYSENEKSVTSDYYIEFLVLLKNDIAKKTIAHEEEKNHLASGQCRMPLVNKNNSQIVSLDTILFRSSPQRLQDVC